MVVESKLRAPDRGGEKNMARRNELYQDKTRLPHAIAAAKQVRIECDISIGGGVRCLWFMLVVMVAAVA